MEKLDRYNIMRFMYGVYHSHLKIKADEELDKQMAKLKEERKQYNFTAGGFLAKVAENSSELIIEGKTLHHCVGTYADRHAKGQCTIILIRKQERAVLYNGAYSCKANHAGAR